MQGGERTSGRRRAVALLGVVIAVSGIPGLTDEGPTASAAAGDVTRVSVDTSGLDPNGPSQNLSLSADGRFVAFASLASNLVPGDTNDDWDVFVRDRQSGTTERVSVSSDGAEGLRVVSHSTPVPSISADGRFVAFDSYSPNLVAGDTNGTGDVFVHDRVSRETTLVSKDAGGDEGNQQSNAPRISGDGRFVAFHSAASDLVAGDTNVRLDVFLHDRTTGAVRRVSTTSFGEQLAAGSGAPAISFDGAAVTFESTATNVVLGDTNGRGDIFLYTTATGAMSRVSVSASGAQANNNSRNGSFSGDGTKLAFSSTATNLVNLPDTNNRGDVFVKDLASGAIERVSRSSAGVQGDNNSVWPRLSHDGSIVGFWSYASNLVSNDTNNTGDAFLHDRTSGETVRASVGFAGQTMADVNVPELSRDGRFFAFGSPWPLVRGDNNGFEDIYVYDRGGDDPPPPPPPPPPPTDEPPAWTKDTPPDGTTYELRQGGIVSFELGAVDHEFADVTVTMVGSHPGLHCLGLDEPEVIASVACMFTSVQPGFSTITFDAKDPAGHSAGPRRFVVGSSRTVALGDSFSSGEGNPIFDAGTATDEVGGTPTNTCHRSTRGFPRLTTSDPMSSGYIDHVACSGAVSLNLYEGQWNEEPQLNVLDEDVSIVTITIGGNDAGFGDVIKRCNVVGIFLSFPGFRPVSCGPFEEPGVRGRFAALAGVPDDHPDITPLVSVYREIRRRAPHARVLVMAYPKMFKAGGTFFNECAGITKADQRWMNSMSELLNAVIERATKQAGVEYVDAGDAFDGHHLCELFAGEWVNDRDFSGIVGNLGTPPNIEYSFHPNAAGHERLAQLALDQLHAGRPGELIRIGPLATHTTTSLVGPGLESATFATSWPGSDVVLSLTSPSGRQIGRTTVAPDVVHDVGPTYEVYTVSTPEPGAWTVTLFGADVPAAGEDVVLDVTETVVPNVPPIAVASHVLSGATVTLDGRGSGDDDGSIVRYEWLLNDGTTLEGPTATHTYEGVGSFDAVLAVTDDDGDVAYAAVSVPLAYGFSGFEPPLQGGGRHDVTPGQAVPIKWRATNPDGSPAVDASSFVRLEVRRSDCITGSTIEDQVVLVEDRASLASTGDGRWRYTWKSPRTGAGECRSLTLVLADGVVDGRVLQLVLRTVGGRTQRI